MVSTTALYSGDPEFKSRPRDGQCWATTTASFHTLSNSLFTNNPVIRHYITQSIENVVKWTRNGNTNHKTGTYSLIFDRRTYVCYCHETHTQFSMHWNLAALVFYPSWALEAVRSRIVSSGPQLHCLTYLVASLNAGDVALRVADHGPVDPLTGHFNLGSHVVGWCCPFRCILRRVHLLAQAGHQVPVSVYCKKSQTSSSYYLYRATYFHIF
jgi:hypothetical protein